MDWRQLPIYAIDFEGSRKSGVLEYGIAELHQSVIGHTRTRLCAAVHPPKAHESRCHRLYAQDLAGYAPFQDDFAIFSSLRKKGLLAAHNATVERRLLCDCWPHPGAVPNFAENGKLGAEWGPWIDTCTLYRRLYPKLPDHSLGFLLNAFSLTESLEKLAKARCPANRASPHCALYDALGAALLLQRLDTVWPVSSDSLSYLCKLSNSFGDFDNPQAGIPYLL